MTDIFLSSIISGFISVVPCTATSTSALIRGWWYAVPLRQSVIILQYKCVLWKRWRGWFPKSHHPSSCLLEAFFKLKPQLVVVSFLVLIRLKQKMVLLVSVYTLFLFKKNKIKGTFKNPKCRKILRRWAEKDKKNCLDFSWRRYITNHPQIWGFFFDFAVWLFLVTVFIITTNISFCLY